jgi:hypothetical protein
MLIIRLSAASLLDRFCKTLPKTVPPCQLGSSLALGYRWISWPSVPKTPNNSSALYQSYSITSLLSANPELPQNSFPNLHSITPRPTPSLPYPPFTDSLPPFTPYLTHLLLLSFLVNAPYPLSDPSFNVFIFLGFIGYPLLYMQPFYIIYH